MKESATQRYQPVTRRNLSRQPEWSRIPRHLREAIRVVSMVLPFRTNRYVLEELIDWERVPFDPIFQLTFPQRGMLAPDDYRATRQMVLGGADPEALRRHVADIRRRLNPHPAGQLSHNVPSLAGRSLPGIQHKYRETVLFFPRQGQTCHAYCSYCFRWPQFVEMPGLRFAASSADDLVAYLGTRPAVSDLLITGGDPLIMRARRLAGLVEPLLAPQLEHVQNLRIGTKAPAYWPARFLTDPDADDCLRLFERIVAAGRHLAVMVHYSHHAELRTEAAREAARRIRSTGAEIRIQAPLIRHVNNDPVVWSRLWELGVRLGMFPYYMFVERDTGARAYFEVPLARALEIYRQAVRRVSGLARTARGPVMSAFPGKVRIAGTTRLDGEKAFVLEMLQGRDPDWAGRIFLARHDPRATWLDDLEPAGDESRFFFEDRDPEQDAETELDRARSA